MYSALYYPHASIESENLIKTALLLWDEIEYIVPWEDFRPDRMPEGEFAQALEIVARPHCPTGDEQESAHAHIAALVENSVPEPFKYRIGSGPNYELYPQKLMHETWELLKGKGLIGGELKNQDYPASRPAGLCIMSILADCCAGSTRLRVTDENVAYATVTNILSDRGGEEAGPRDLAGEQLIPQSMRVLDASKISMKRLIEFRNREAAGGGHDYRALRHRYVDSVQEHFKNLAKPDVTLSDRKVLEREFEVKMRDDLAILKDELGYANSDVLWSKEMLTAVLAPVAAVGAALALPFAIPAIASATGAAVSVGGLVSMRNKYLAARAAMMRRHPMAYLYELGR